MPFISKESKRYARAPAKRTGNTGVDAVVQLTEGSALLPAVALTFDYWKRDQSELQRRYARPAIAIPGAACAAAHAFHR